MVFLHICFRYALSVQIVVADNVCSVVESQCNKESTAANVKFCVNPKK
jgi:hypothetical protein